MKHKERERERDRTRVTDKQTSFRMYERNLYNERNSNYNKSAINICFY